LGPAQLLESSNRGVTVGVAALASVIVNNLPAAVVLTAHRVVHPRALLLGLNLGPNLAVTGSLSAFVWTKAARTVGAEPDWRRVTRLGVVLVPLSLAAAAGALALVAPTHL
jgi:arsenical pump membrane protein